MALIVEFHQIASDRNSIHKPVGCGWRVFNVDRRTILQLDTYGSDERQIPNKVSQSIQLDPAGAVTLMKLLRDTFGDL